MEKENPFKSAFDIYKLAYSPYAFQIARIIYKNRLIDVNEKLSFDEILDKNNFSSYSLKLILDAGCELGLLKQESDIYCLSLSGSFLLKDKTAGVTFDFMHEICFKGAYYLEESLLHEYPEGLKTLSDQNTIYNALNTLNEQQQKSWFEFDNHFSDIAYEKIFSEVDFSKIRTILDLGGNKGNFVREVVSRFTDVEVTIADLPGQIEKAKDNLKEISGINFVEVDILKEPDELKGCFDLIVMSQFLDCFSLKEVSEILKKVYGLLSNSGIVVIVELFCDKQKMPIAEYSLKMLSLYFTNIANGNSRMYDSDQLIKELEKALFNILSQKHNIGMGHSLLLCSK